MSSACSATRRKIAFYGVCLSTSDSSFLLRKTSQQAWRSYVSPYFLWQNMSKYTLIAQMKSKICVIRKDSSFSMHLYPQLYASSFKISDTSCQLFSSSEEPTNQICSGQSKPYEKAFSSLHFQAV